MQQKQNQNKINDNLKEQYLRYISFWPYILLSIISSLIICYVFLRYADYEYRTTAKIEIIDKAQDSEMALPSSMTIFNRSMINLENEIGVLSSYNLHKNVVSALNFNVNYYTIGLIKINQIHKSDFFREYKLDFKTDLDLIASSSKYEITFEINNFKINAFENDELIKSYEFSEFSTYNQSHELPFDLEVNKAFLADDPSSEPDRIIEINSFTNTVKHFVNKTKISQLGRESDQLLLTMNHTNKKIAEDYLNTLVNKFDLDGIIDRQLEYKRTMDFVDNRSVLLSQELEQIELKKQLFKEKNNLTDIDSDANVSISQQITYDSELFEVISQKDLLTLIEGELKSDEYELLPINIGIENSSLNDAIISYNSLINEREKLLFSGIGLKNTLITNLNSKLDNGYNNILNTLQNSKEALEFKIDNLKLKESEFEAMYSDIPKNEKILRSIQRELEVKESLFLLLLQKREEAAINNAVVKPSIKVVDNAMGSDYPISPNRTLNYITFLFIGFLIPIGFLSIWFYFDTKIHTKDQLKKLLDDDIPIISELPHIHDPIDLNTITSTNSRNPLAESIRMIIANLNFILFNKDNSSKQNKNIILVTSSVKGEGKTLVSTNFASALSFNNKKVLLIGADLRNPQIHKLINKSKDEKGLSDFIYNNDLNWEELIIKYNSLDIILSGTIPPNPTELLSSKKFKDFISEVSSKYDYIVIDSAPALLVSDTFEITKYVSSTLYIFRANFSDNVLTDFINESKRLKKFPSISIVFNSVGNSKQYGYKYGYQYGYKYGYKYNYGYGYGYNADN